MYVNTTIFTFPYSSYFSFTVFAQSIDSTFGEKLAYPKDAKVLILHVDDAGMSFDSNEGGDMPAMMNPAFKKALQSEGIILTTWRQLKERRARVK